MNGNKEIRDFKKSLYFFLFFVYNKQKRKEEVQNE